MKQAVPWWFFFPDVTFRYLMWLLRIAAVPWGWCDFSRLMWLKYGACRMLEDMPDRMPEGMPDRMPDKMSDRMPEDLPVTKCINVMVGITRSKVIFIEGSLEVKLPTVWTDEKQSRAEAERRGRLEERRSEEKESGRKKMQMREKVGKSRNTVFFQWFVAPEGRKVGSLKRRVRSQLATGAMKNCTPLWREAHFEVKMCKTHQVRTTFGSWDVEKVHAVVARSTFRSQKC